MSGVQRAPRYRRLGQTSYFLQLRLSVESLWSDAMPHFNWDELDLEHRRYVCFLAGVHESYAILWLRYFHERARSSTPLIQDLLSEAVKGV